MTYHKQHVLIADDEPQVLTLFTRLLRADGYSVSAVRSGNAAIKAVDDDHVDLLILDLSMPRTDGFDVLRALRTRRPGLRILVISGCTHAGLLQASEILGAAASLNKEDAPKLLLKTVASILQ